MNLERSAAFYEGVLGLEVLETSVEIGRLWVQDPDGHILEVIVPRVA